MMIPEKCQGTNCGTTTCQHSRECLEESASEQGWPLPAAQQQAEPATPSEDGGEVPEVVANFDGLYLTPLVMMEKGSELMTVAQHERIVADKDAEIARLRDLNEHQRETIAAFGDELQELKADREPSEEFCDWWEGPEVRRLIGDSAPAIIWAERGWNAAISSQPARQGGRDEREARALFEDMALIADDEKCIQILAAALAPAAPSEIEVDIEGLGCCQLQIVDGKAFMPSVTVADILRMSAIAPAAVAVDSSAPLVNAFEQVRTMVGNDEYADDVIGFINQSIYNHARLNRRAIPLELLERVVFEVVGLEIASGLNADATDELRALLGKS